MCRQTEPRHGAYGFIRICGEALGDSWAKSSLVNSNPKGPGRQGRLLLTRTIGEVLSGAYIYFLYLCRLFSRVCTCI